MRTRRRPNWTLGDYAAATLGLTLGLVCVSSGLILLGMQLCKAGHL